MCYLSYLTTQTDPFFTGSVSITLVSINFIYSSKRFDGQLM